MCFDGQKRSELVEKKEKNTWGNLKGYVKYLHSRTKYH